MKHFRQTDALLLGCKSRRTEQLLGRTDSKPTTKGGNRAFPGGHSGGRGRGFPAEFLS